MAALELVGALGFIGFGVHRVQGLGPHKARLLRLKPLHKMMFRFISIVFSKRFPIVAAIPKP